MADTERIPNVGDPLGISDVQMIYDAIELRKEQWPNDDDSIHWAVVFFNIGNRFAPVQCVAGEWSGLKKDIPPRDGIPLCPNGHVMTEGTGLRLGWVSDELPTPSIFNKAEK